jgi:hypothetical protein
VELDFEKVRRNTNLHIEVENFETNQPNMPQNEYMERFAKQYVSSYLHNYILCVLADR